MSDLVPIRRALLSVSDKTGLVEFAKALNRFGVELISTGGTAAALKQAGLPVTPIDDVTGFPEILGGRVKTLHPMVHGGLLGVRDDPAHAAQMAQHDIRPIDLVCVNLYPFERTIARPGTLLEEAVEQIDIGGPAMVRSASKNFRWVTVVTDPSQYQRIIDGLSEVDGKTTLALRAELAAAAFARTSRYDAAIADYLAPAPRHAGPARQPTFPAALTLRYEKVFDLRYGENPHQAAAAYRDLDAGDGPSVLSARQLHGKELSFNNLADAAAALRTVRSLAGVDPASVSAVIVKHTNPCGAGLAPTSREAIDLALAGDPLAAYGGILAVSSAVDDDAAQRFISPELFLEVIVAPSFSPGALEKLRARWANIRLLEVGVLAVPTRPASTDHGLFGPPHLELRPVPGGLLAQQPDEKLARGAEVIHAAGPAPSTDQLRAAAFLEVVARSLTSNAIAIGGPAPESRSTPPGLRLFGAGAGQMDRVAACRIAVQKAGPLAHGAIAFSDAFFPFSDGPQVLIDAGVTTLVHPGGSKRDPDTFELCNQRGVTCLTTGLRHFRH
ncbi:MAG: bifunctional phosphoribosylaminoimidazolecarboxamide formyltransferase/IMP cyclohydrolase [Phycisphaerales bacterium]|nr:bifunctional phosphoribosylaminoimidazolecarboxamide formyltransferase/IMP cyclohydrolase [Phycisphaerales bacterium]